jgi:hypothetical protein
MDIRGTWGDRLLVSLLLWQVYPGEAFGQNAPSEFIFRHLTWFHDD